MSSPLFKDSMTVNPFIFHPHRGRSKLFSLDQRGTRFHLHTLLRYLTPLWTIEIYCRDWQYSPISRTYTSERVAAFNRSSSFRPNEELCTLSVFARVV